MNYLGFSREQINPIVNELNKLLANYQLYYQNLRNFHWNVSGTNFFDLHEKFEALYDDARVKIDEIAERTLTLRSKPLSRLSDYLEHAAIEEAEITENDGLMIDIILGNHRLLIQNMRSVLEAADAVGDEGTIDMIGGFLANMEKKSWMLDAWRTEARSRKQQPAKPSVF